MGAQNFVVNLAGAVAPALTGFLVDRTGRFYWPFLITSAITWVARFNGDSSAVRLSRWCEREK
jgi:hypothetical protein